MNVITIQPHPAIPGRSLLFAVKGDTCKVVYAACFAVDNERAERRETTKAMELYAPGADLHFKVFGIKTIKGGGKVCYLKQHLQRVDGVVSVKETARKGKGKAESDAPAEDPAAAPAKKTRKTKKKAPAAPSSALLPLPGDTTAASMEAPPPPAGKKGKKGKKDGGAKSTMSTTDAAAKREAGRKRYQSFLKKYKKANPAATREQIKAAWTAHKGA